MSEKDNNKNQTKKGDKKENKEKKNVNTVDKKENKEKKNVNTVDKKENKEKKNVNTVDKKEKKEKKNVDTIDKLLEKITVDTVIETMVEHKCLVAKSITMKIIGEDAFEKLSDVDKQIIVKKVNELRMKNQ